MVDPLAADTEAVTVDMVVDLEVVMVVDSEVDLEVVTVVVSEVVTAVEDTVVAEKDGRRRKCHC